MKAGKEAGFKTGDEPKLSYKPGKDVFRVPEGYFESLTDKVVDRITTERPLRKLHANANRFQKIAIPLAAASLLVFFLIRQYAPTSESRNNSTLQALAGTDTQSGKDLIVLDEDSFDEIISDLNLASIDETIYQDSTLSAESIIDFLSQHKIDDNLLAEL